MRTVLPSVLVALTLCVSLARADPPRPAPSRPAFAASGRPAPAPRPARVSRLPLWVPSAEIGAGLGALVAGGLLARLGHTLNVPELIDWAVGVAATGSIFGGVGIVQMSSLLRGGPGR